MPFQSRRIRLPNSIPSVDLKIARPELAIQRIYQNEASRAHRNNLTKTKQEGFGKLIRLKHKLRLMVGDKCGSFVAVPQSLDKETVRHTLLLPPIPRLLLLHFGEHLRIPRRDPITSVVKPRLGSNVARNLLIYILHPGEDPQATIVSCT
ncbi:hypothetical protein Y032_0585g317 [Ancylostoma ceylanicum]|uniref:Uncharacterized protein n=1 Tax=Ancylostoma ceylanicum TaxID=53326 RepID=A0A016WN42_9BILA|nr:hypothetical protein Y032_0585g317 [Ancylostoma ceylanicum]